MQLGHNTNGTECKWDKMQIVQFTNKIKFNDYKMQMQQNVKDHNANGTKFK